MKPKKEPRDHKFCSKCDKPYGFINCRLTLHEKGGSVRNICLTCGVIEEKEQERLAAKL